jgi:hypothetical protein
MKQKIFQILAFILLGTISSQAYAISLKDAVFTTYPTNTEHHNSWIIKDVNPGQQQKESITVKNLTDQPIQLSISFREMEGDRQNAKIIENENFKNIGNWIKLDQTSVNLAPNQSQKIGFTIQTPGDTKLGEYQGTILVSYFNNNQPPLNLVTRIGNRIYLNVTDSKILESNTTNLEITPLQIALIILSSLGIIYGLKNNKKSQQKS